MAALDHDIEKLLPAALYKKGFDLCAAFSTKAYNDTTKNKKLHDFGRRNGARVRRRQFKTYLAVLSAVRTEKCLAGSSQ